MGLNYGGTSGKGRRMAQALTGAGLAIGAGNVGGALTGRAWTEEAWDITTTTAATIREKVTILFIF